MRKQIALKHTYRHVYTYPGASTECHSFNVFINTFNNDAKSKLLEFKLGALSRHLELLLNALLHCTVLDVPHNLIKALNNSE